jgi:hypothetical protein
MMMKNQITSRDYELISAYLDNQLGSKDRIKLEERLKLEPELRKEMHEISKTRVLIRSLPRLRAPRNFYITEKDNLNVRAKPVGLLPNRRLSPALGIVSAIATILLALVIFGDTLLTSTTPVALSPAVEAPSEALSVQQEIEQVGDETPPPTEAAPLMLMGAPAASTPPPSEQAFKIGESWNATPTTIYLYAYPPTATPEHPLSILNDQTEIAGRICESYYATGASPTEAYLYHCPTPTNTPSYLLQGTLPTATPTPSPTSTPTPTPSPTPSPSPSPTPTATEVVPSGLNAAATVEEEVPLGKQPGSANADSTNRTLPVAQTTETPETSPNIAFLRYVVLAVEVSLAAIAIIAGVTAIILRIRAG